MNYMLNLLPALKSSLHALVALGLAGAACSAPASQGRAPTAAQEHKPVELRIPDDPWVADYFEVINERARIAGLDDLRAKDLSGEDLEVRVWIGFGVVALRGYVITRTGGQWAALHVPSVGPNDRDAYPNVPVFPKSGWESLWRRLSSEGILTLPDSTQLKVEERTALDGGSYVVEINTKRTYRTYRYTSPQLQKSPESKHMVNIIETLREEFGSGQGEAQSLGTSKDQTPAGRRHEGNSIDAVKALAIAKKDAAEDYEPLDEYKITVSEVERGWRVVFGPKDPREHGGGLQYIIDKRTGEILHKVVTQ